MPTDARPRAVDVAPLLLAVKSDGWRGLDRGREEGRKGVIVLKMETEAGKQEFFTAV
jgi:hypothetical protein